MRALLLASVALVAACVSTSSEGIQTSAMYADFSATADEDGAVTVFAHLKVGGASSNTFVDLAPGDQLVARRGGTAMTMSRVEVIQDIIGYRATFPAQGQGGGGVPFTIDLERDGERSALGSTVSMPPLFSTITPAAGASVSRAVASTITWDPAGTGMIRVRILGTCASLPEREVPDTGSLQVQPIDWTVQTDGAAETCDATLTLERSATGTVAADFGEGGRFVGIQKREVAIRSAP